MKKFIITVIIVVMVLTSMVGCGKVDTQTKISAPKNILAFSTASIGSFLSVLQTNNNITSTSFVENISKVDKINDDDKDEEIDLDDVNDIDGFNQLENQYKGSKNDDDDDDDFHFSSQDKTPSEEDINTINQYIAMVEGLLSSNPIQSVDEVSDRSEYQYKVTVTSFDLAGKSTVFILYFNQKLVTENSNETNKKETKDDDSNSEIDVDESYTIEGIMIVNDVEYMLKGEKEVEADGYEFSLIAIIDSKNFIKLVQEVEADEQKIFYSIHQDGKQVQRFMLNIENEENESEIKIMSSIGQEVSHVIMEKEIENGETVINIILKQDKSVIRCQVTVTVDADGKNVYEYKYNNGVAKRNGKGHSSHDSHYGNI